MTNELAKRDGGEMSVQEMMGAIVSKDITPETVSVMKELVSLKREMDADTNRAAFNRDFLALRKECGPIAATRTIPTKDGGIKGRFASLEDIVGEVSPLLEKYGFADTYSQSSEGGRTKVTVTLLHSSGHERSSEYSCREHASPNNSAAQNDGGTNKMARRHALCNMLGIVLDYSPDARLEGDTISAFEAEELERRVMTVCGGDVGQAARYLRLGDAKTFPEMRRAKYDVVAAQLERDEARGSQTPAAASGKSTRVALAEAVSRWSGLGKDELGEAVGSVFKASGIATSGKATEDQCRAALEWVEANSGQDFFDAVRK